MDDKKVEMVGYHGTPFENAEDIIKNDFNIRDFSISSKSKQKVPCDLGNGIYLFLNSLIFNNNAEEMAGKYVKFCKYKSSNHAILKVVLSFDEDESIIDMNDEDFKRDFNKLRNDFEPIVVDLCKDNIRWDKAYERGNLDGLLLEYMFDSWGNDPILVMGDTFTRVNKCYKISNAPNCREVAVRKQHIIKTKEICKII